MKPLFVSNLENDTRQSDLEHFFSKYGKVEQIDLKSGYAFVYFENWYDAEEAIRETGKRPFGNERRKLSVEWAKAKPGKRRYLNPTKTLFVRNLNPVDTKERDVEKKFERYGKVVSIRMRHNFAFVQFENQEDATKAHDCTHNTKILDRIVVVEYAWKDGKREEKYAVNPRNRCSSSAAP